MPRPLKYLEGEVITNPMHAVREILAGNYLIVNGRRQHPAWMGAQQLHQIRQSTRRGAIRKAIPNPFHPDHKETT